MNYITVSFFILLSLALIFTGVVYSSYNQRKREKGSIIFSLVVDALFLAILLIMGFVPNMGFISVTPFISLTLMHLPVLLAASFGGWRKGLLMGTLFGLVSYIQAISSGVGFNAFFTNPLVAILPRAAFGLLAGFAFSFLGKVSKARSKGLYLAVASPILTGIHTGLVFAMLALFYPEVRGLLVSKDPVSEGASITFLAVIGLGMIGEMVLASASISALHLALSKAMPRLAQYRHH